MAEVSEVIHPHGYWLSDFPDGSKYDPGLSEAIVALCSGQSVADVGCGRCKYLKALKAAGVNARGFDGNPETPSLDDGAEVADLALPHALAAYDRADTVLCLEVGEHIPAEYEATFLDNLCGMAKSRIILSWAVPGRPETGHVNCQSNGYVYDQMRNRSFYCNGKTTEQLRMKPNTLDYFRHTLMVFDRKAPADVPTGRTPHILVGMPYSHSPHQGSALRLWTGSSRRADVTPMDHSTSLLARNFNILFCTALTMRDRGDITHFAMLHDDVVPCDGWLDILLDELEAHDADMVSSVVAIKDHRGLSSTAIADPRTPWNVAKRLTMKELMELPATFSAADCGWPERALLVNTGCWLADLRRPVFQFTENPLPLFFTIKDRIIHENGVYQAQCEPEDWFFSRLLHERGGRVVATRKTGCAHYGNIAFLVDRPWGDLQEDDVGTIAELKKMAENNS
jgi:hypothetical protein